MNITVIGCGHIGLVAAGAFAQLGHFVVGVDDDPDRVASLQAGRVPIYEPGLDHLIRKGMASGRIRFTREASEGVTHGEVIFICVGTPARATGEANLVFVERVAELIARYAPAGYRLVVEKSTVPVQTGERIALTLARNAAPGAELDVASNPEFLREGTAIEDFLKPERIVVGVSTLRARETLRKLYEPLLADTGCPFIVTDIRTAELIKHACNAFLATKISFMNSIAQICERTGADVEAIAFAMGADSRIGAGYLRAGAGYGGACLPKDVDAFARLAREVGFEFNLLEEVARVNAAQRASIVEKVRAELWNLEGKQIAILGLAFKPETDDIRNAPSLEVIRALVAAGARVRVYDPTVTSDAASGELPGLRPCLDVYEALSGSHCAVVLTEWEEFRSLDLTYAREIMAYPIVVDGRNVFSPKDMFRAGFTYIPVGRPAVRPVGTAFENPAEVGADA
jgi:UDPglucose 6-dehydrogenase